MIINRNRGGITPKGTINITENGTYDVEEFANASVAVSSLYPTVYPTHCKYIVVGDITTGTSDNYVVPKGIYAWDGTNENVWAFAYFIKISGDIQNSVVTSVFNDMSGSSMRMIRSYNNYPRSSAIARTGACAYVFSANVWHVTIFVCDNNLSEGNVPAVVDFSDFATIETS